MCSSVLKTINVRNKNYLIFSIFLYYKIQLKNIININIIIINIISFIIYFNFYNFNNLLNLYTPI